MTFVYDSSGEREDKMSGRDSIRFAKPTYNDLISGFLLGLEFCWLYVCNIYDNILMMYENSTVRFTLPGDVTVNYQVPVNMARKNSWLLTRGANFRDSSVTVGAINKARAKEERRQQKSNRQADGWVQS